MKINHIMSMLSCVLALGTLVSCGEPSQLANSQGVSTQNGQTQTSHEKLKSSDMSAAVDRCLSNLSAAEEKMRSILSQGQAKRKLEKTGIWGIWEKSTNGFYHVTFKSETGPVQSFAFIPGGGNRLDKGSGGEFSIVFDSDGRPERYEMDGSGLLEFHPGGGLRHCHVRIDDNTFGIAWWELDGRLKSERVKSSMKSRGVTP